MSQDSSSRIAKRRTAALQDGGADYAERRAELIRIAAEVFVSRKTVEANLSKVYRKLGVSSRVELARRLPR